tara:strand:+ start:631 stop:882 length:252 start_codon:yes stop_codon:yes gene_type:complete
MNMENETPKKVRKPLSDEALEKLKMARERAAESKRLKKQEKLEKSRAMDPIVVVEQSSDDSDELEGPPGVIFVRRRRNKSKNY